MPKWHILAGGGVGGSNPDPFTKTGILFYNHNAFIKIRKLILIDNSIYSMVHIQITTIRLVNTSISYHFILCVCVCVCAVRML